MLTVDNHGMSICMVSTTHLTEREIMTKQVRVAIEIGATPEVKWVKSHE
jgi:hypothetical protein